MKDIAEQIIEKEKELQYLKELKEADFNRPENQVRRLVSETLPQNGRGVEVFHHSTYYDSSGVRIEFSNNISAWRFADTLKDNGYYFANIYTGQYSGDNAAMTWIVTKIKPPVEKDDD